MQISELYSLCAELFKEFAPLKGKGLVTKEVGKFTIEVTADKGIEKGGIRVDPFMFTIYQQDCPIALIAPDGGRILGASAGEDKLIDYFKDRIGDKQNPTE